MEDPKGPGFLPDPWFAHQTWKNLFILYFDWQYKILIDYNLPFADVKLPTFVYKRILCSVFVPGMQ